MPMKALATRTAISRRSESVCEGAGLAAGTRAERGFAAACADGATAGAAVGGYDWVSASPRSRPDGRARRIERLVSICAWAADMRSVGTSDGVCGRCIRELDRPDGRIRFCGV